VAERVEKAELVRLVAQRVQREEETAVESVDAALAEIYLLANE
jgi:hypothetical protein